MGYGTIMSPVFESRCIVDARRTTWQTGIGVNYTETAVALCAWLWTVSEFGVVSNDDVATPTGRCSVTYSSFLSRALCETKAIN